VARSRWRGQRDDEGATQSALEASVEAQSEPGGGVARTEARKQTGKLTPPGNEAAVLLRYGRPEGRAGMGEPTPDPGRVFAVGKPRVRELELQGDRLETAAGQPRS
jgi:hypothetical protein